MMAGDTYFTLLLDVQNSVHPLMGTFVEKVSRGMPPSGCRIRVAAYGTYKTGETAKLLMGRYVSTCSELCRQWEAVAKVSISCGKRRLDATLAALFKDDVSEKSAKKVCVIVSSLNWSANPSCMTAIAPTCASGVEVQFVSPNNADAVLALMQACLKPRISVGRAATSNFLSTVSLKELSAFNNHIVDGLLRFQQEIDISRFLRPIVKGGYGWREEELVERYHEVCGIIRCSSMSQKVLA